MGPQDSVMRASAIVLRHRPGKEQSASESKEQVDKRVRLKRCLQNDAADGSSRQKRRGTALDKH